MFIFATLGTACFYYLKWGNLSIAFKNQNFCQVYYVPFPLILITNNHFNLRLIIIINVDRALNTQNAKKKTF